MPTVQYNAVECSAVNHNSTVLQYTVQYIVQWNIQGAKEDKCSLDSATRPANYGSLFTLHWSVTEQDLLKFGYQ